MLIVYYLTMIFIYCYDETVCTYAKSLQSCWTVVLHTPLSMGSSRQEYWSGLPFPPPDETSLINSQNSVSRKG